MNRYGFTAKRRVFIKQRDERDCGPACLCSICMHYGVMLPLAKARELAKTDLQGTNAYGIAKAAETIGFNAQVLNGTYVELIKGLSCGELRLPAIVHVVTQDNFEHFIVLYEIRGNRITILDPAIGKRTLQKGDFLQQWTGVVIDLEKTGEIYADFKTVKLTNLIVSLIGQNKGLVAWVVAVSFSLTAIGIVSAFIFQYVIDDVVMKFTGSNRTCLLSTFARICIAIISLYAVQAVLTFIRGYCLARFANRLDVSIMMDFYNRMISLPMNFFGTRKTGEILSRFSDAAKIRDAISSITFTALIDCVMVAAGVTILWLLSWKLACIAFSLFLIYIVIIGAFSRRLESRNKKMMESNAQLNSFLKESIDGVETIKVFVQEHVVKKKAMRKLESLIDQSFKLRVMVNNQSAIIGFVSSVATIGILWVGVIQIMNGAITLGSLITFNALIGFFLIPLERIIGLQPEIQSAFVALERLNDINDLAPEDIEEGKVDADSLNPIEVCDVSFGYGNRNLVLDKVSLRIEKGEKLALVGESGSGKTTLSKLLLALYEPGSGSVRIGGRDIGQYSKKYLRGKVAYLSQENFLFYGTIKDNILLGDLGVSDEDFMAVCRQCKVTDFVDEMPLGFDSIVEERGVNLSGGQKQRIALARVLIRKPEILILDEATSNLDSRTEQAVINAIFHFAEGVTCILIAHRLNTIVGCDRIALMEGGRIIEVGSHEYLLRQKGKYFGYWMDLMGNMIEGERSSTEVF